MVPAHSCTKFSTRSTLYILVLPVSLSSIVFMKPEVHRNLQKSNIRKRHNVSFVGLGGFYFIFQHTYGKRPHSMACRGQHGWEFTEPEMIAKIIRIGTRYQAAIVWFSRNLMTMHAWCGGACVMMTHHAAAAPSAAAHQAEARTATHCNLASSTLVSEGTRLTVCL